MKKRTLFLMLCILVSPPAAVYAELAYEVEWIRQLGANDYYSSRAVAVDRSDNVFISGFTDGWDAFVAKYDTFGNLLWTEQLGTSDSDYSLSVAVDGSGNAFNTGWTYGSLAEPNDVGGRDAFLAKYDASGNLLWTEQLGTSADDYSLSVAVDELGNLFISGDTSGSLEGSNAGVGDAFVAKYDTLGNLLWTEQLGTSDNDYSTSVAVDDAGNVFISGHTYGAIDGTSVRGGDAFLVRFSPVPEPSTRVRASRSGGLRSA